MKRSPYRPVISRIMVINVNLVLNFDSQTFSYCVCVALVLNEQLVDQILKFLFSIFHFIFYFLFFSLHYIVNNLPM